MSPAKRVKVLDLGFILAILAAATVTAFEVQLFPKPGQAPAAKTIELDEFLLLTTLAVWGILFYAWRRAREHRRENALRRAAERELLTLALQDPLTGLPNRRRLDRALDEALRRAPAAPEAHAVFAIDLNGFKTINDLHGHPVGDQVLVQVGTRLLRAVREADLVARPGGDEFVVLARNLTGAEAAAGLAQRIVDGLAAPVVVDGTAHRVGAAIGVALAPQDAGTAEELMRKADVALYRAKEQSGSAVRFYEERMDERLRERDALERALAAAMAQDAFALRFRPTRDAHGGITAFEALPRWHDAALGEIAPERFLTIAQETGLLAALTETLLRKACAAAASWPAQLRLGFNLPSALLADPGFGLRILAALGESGVAPTRLDLEIDEGALVRGAATAETMLAPLRRTGMRIIADHFGTGYADLQNLQRLRLDGVKIDESFVAAMLRDRRAAVFVNALIAIGRGLDLAVSADGVGTPQQREALTAQGCLEAQGALAGEALDAAGTLRALAESHAPASSPDANRRERA